jgi:ferritin-like metal-binding protein YciE
MTHQDTQDVQQKHAQTIADYVGDMVALESHIEEALDRQLTETQDDPEAHAAVQRFHDMVKQHRDTLKALQEQVGTTAGNPIIAAGSAVLGQAAGVIERINEIMPGVVERELAKDGHQTNNGAMVETRTMAATAWKVTKH